MRVLIAVLCLSTVWGYRHFQDEIPNGGIVPHPCKANYTWAGVGHLNPRGGADRNPFGVDFKNAGMTWTKTLCEMDSDGDGKTNGEELGDPDCVWTKGNAPAITLGLSHPGVCTPHSTTACQAANTWIDCDIGGLNCDVFNEVGVKNVILKMPETVVPPNPTNYYCMIFELPTDGDYHIVAIEPHIENVDVNHHMVLYSCDDPGETATNFWNSPQPCQGNGPKECQTLMSAWVIGAPGQCMHRDAGFRIGQNGYRYVLIEAHWNNVELRSDYTASSGLKLYYTPHRRPHDATMWQIGANYIEIPPGEDEVEVESYCSKDCTSQYLSGPIYITRAMNHMHYLGRKQKIQQYRNGVWIRDITNDDKYDFNRYTDVSFATPIEVLPGDEIKTTCTFQSVDRDMTTFAGYGTLDEMCFGFIQVYPQQNINDPTCVSWKSLDMCKLSGFSVIDGCNIKNSMNPLLPDTIALFTNLKTYCKPFDICTQECKQYVIGLLANNKCFRGDIGHFLRSKSSTLAPYFLEIWAAIDSCKMEIEMDACQVRCDLAKDRI